MVLNFMDLLGHFGFTVGEFLKFLMAVVIIIYYF